VVGPPNGITSRLLKERGSVMSDVETTSRKRLLAHTTSICQVPLLAAGVLTAALASPVRAGDGECFEWLRVQPDGRAGHNLVWDGRREVLVRFGGVHDSHFDPSGETWEWNGRRWRLAAEDGPSPRRGSAMIFDERRGVVVLFGGADDVEREFYADTWEWDGESWTQREVEGPSPRAWHAMAYDSDRGVTVLAGGRLDNDNLQETWEWDGQVWTLRDAEMPNTGLAAKMVYDRKRQNMVLYAGERGYLWEWDGNTWIRRDAPGPDGRLWFSFVYDSRRNVSVLVGGTDGESLADMWEWDGEHWTQLDRPPLEPRHSAAMTFDSMGERLLLVGGRAVLYGRVGQATSDVWEYSRGAWTRVHGSAPPWHDKAHMVYDTARNVTVVAGGIGGGQPIWEWTGRQWQLRPPANPQEMYVRRAAYDPDLRETIVISRDDPIELWTWRQPYWRAYKIENAPSIDNGGVMTFDEGRGVAVIVGNGGQTWEWSGRRDRLDLRSNDGPGVVAYSAIAYDSARGVSVFLGGRRPEAGTTWEWDGQSWTLASREGPGDVSGHSMTYDTRRELTVTFGGDRFGQGRINEVWRWDGEVWRQLETAGTRSPSPRDSAGFVYDRQRDVFVAYGGRGGDRAHGGELWELTPVVCCDDARKLAARCREGGLVAKLRLRSDAYDGRVVTLLANGNWQDATVRGDRARAKFTSLSGSVEISLETPSGCGLRRQVECN